MSTFTWDNAQKFVVVQLANFNDDSSPPPGSEFRVIDAENPRITDSGTRRITD